MLEGHYLFEVDGDRFVAETGDVVSVPGGAAHAIVSLSRHPRHPARQLVIITPGLDAVVFFTGLAAVMKDGIPDPASLNLFKGGFQ